MNKSKKKIPVLPKLQKDAKSKLVDYSLKPSQASKSTKESFLGKRSRKGKSSVEKGQHA